MPSSALLARGIFLFFCVAPPLVRAFFLVPPSPQRRVDWLSATKKKNNKKKGRLLREFGDDGPSRALTAIPGISAPIADDRPKGWDISGVRLAAVKRGDELFVMDASCRRCAWDLDKGTVEDDCLCCPLCGQCYDLKTGDPGAMVDRNFLGNLARKAPTTKPPTRAKVVRAELRSGGGGAENNNKKEEVLLDLSEGSYLAAQLAASSSSSSKA
mmetsp:Transcript_37973/g.121865  ORF Transcript_37973/g.121865 Transcript_37973/m.121865 type:complete len:213 (+) Transcript_37973:49-687(+)